MDMPIEKVLGKRPVERKHARGLTAFIDHDSRTVRIELTLIDQATIDAASELVERLAMKGYENI